MSKKSAFRALPYTDTDGIISILFGGIVVDKLGIHILVVASQRGSSHANIGPGHAIIPVFNNRLKKQPFEIGSTLLFKIIPAK
jgi:hypothetical protein